MREYIEVLRKYAVFEGRATRREYWMFSLIHILVIFATIFTSYLAHNFIFMALYGLVTYVPSMAVTVRRLHDTGRSGWWFLLNFIPTVGNVALLIFMILESDGNNAYGPYERTISRDLLKT